MRMTVARPVTMHLITFGDNRCINCKSRRTFVADPFTYHTDKRYNKYAYHKKEHNEKLLNSLTADWTFLEKNAKAVLVDGKFEDFKNKPSAAIIKKYFDDLSQLHYYFARNRRKNKIT